MATWFLEEVDRLEQERAGIEGLRRTADWLILAEWGLEFVGDELWLCVDAVIRAHGHDYEVRLSYPSHFPEAPLIVCPRNATSRWSGHQYGDANGSLCLEYGPDNWHPALTGVQMLESAHRLLVGENPLGNPSIQTLGPVPSRHYLTPGQELRGTSARWYFSEGLRAFLARQPDGTGSLKFSFRDKDDFFMVLIHQATAANDEQWVDEQIPDSIPGATGNFWDGVWFRLSEGSTEDVRSLKGIEALRTLAVSSGHPSNLLATDGTSPVAGFQRAIRGILVLEGNGTPHFFVGHSGDKTICCREVSSAPSAPEARLSKDNDLTGKTIGIVGLGSAGSKIAESLARAGAREFLLVDYDVFLPENMVRHTLDWRNVGEHKAAGVAATLRLIAAGMKAKVSRLHLTGQESNASLNVTLQDLGACDLLIDATADAQVFNRLAAVVKNAGKPLVWLEIFAGGIGGMIARSRPQIDPPPQQMRAALLAFCREQNVAAPRATRDYGTEDGEGTVLTASDADVAIVAHHAARLAIDTVLTPSFSRYPFSMYLLGLAAAWIFQAPFDTVPVDVSPYQETPAAPSADQADAARNNLEFVSKLLAKRPHAPADPA